jgi:hypothetical protein
MTVQYELVQVPVDYVIEPDSSFIDTVAFDSDGGHTYVVMHGHTYYYDDVPYEAFVRLAMAQSPGHEYSTYFRDTFGPADRLDGNFQFTIREDGGVKDNPTIEETHEVPGPVENPDSKWDNRFTALDCASRVYQGSEPIGVGLVLDAARTFERYLNGE